MRQAENGEERQDQHVTERACRVVRARANQPDGQQGERSNAPDARELEPTLLGAQEHLFGATRALGHCHHLFSLLENLFCYGKRGKDVRPAHVERKLRCGCELPERPHAQGNLRVPGSSYGTAFAPARQRLQGASPSRIERIEDQACGGNQSGAATQRSTFAALRSWTSSLAAARKISAIASKRPTARSDALPICASRRKAGL